MAAAIVIDGLSFRYRGGCEALRGVSLAIDAGTLVGLLGPNGSGKSTLLALIAQLRTPAGGTIEVLGSASPAAIRARVGVVFQSPALDTRLTIRENLRAHAALQGLPVARAEARIAELAAAHALADRLDQRVGTLSGGLVRRADLARALLHEPPVLLLDEPTAGLDPPSREALLLSLRREVERRGATVLLTTHLVDEADACDRVVMMHRGSIVADDSPHALRARLGPRLVVVAGDPPPATLEGLGHLAWVRRPAGWTASLEGDEEVRGAVEALADSGRSFSLAPPTLADLFSERTGTELAGAVDAEVPHVG